jgi:RNA polymerase sigma factor (sigma-70 family)
MIDREKKSREFMEYLTPLYSSLFQHALHLCRNRHTADDIFQECSLRLWQAWLKKADDVEWNAGYAHTALKYAYFGHLRKMQTAARREVLRSEIDEPLAIAELPNYVWANNDERIAVVTEFLRNLPERTLEVYILNKVKEFTPKEIGDAVGLSPRTVSTYLSSVNKQVKKLLSELS